MAKTPLRAESACANPADRHCALNEHTFSQFATTQKTAPLCAGAMVVGAADWMDAIAASMKADKTFWALRDAWLKIATAWERLLKAEPQMDNATFAWWGDRYSISHTAMMTARVTTLPALYAKMEACDGEPQNTINGPDGQSRFQLLMWDVLTLIAKRGAA